MRFLVAILFLVAGAAVAAPVTIETRADGAIVSYDPASRHEQGVWMLMNDEVVYQEPRDCAPKGCVKIERWTRQYSCGNRILARLKVTTLDASGSILLEKKYQPLLTPIRDDDTTGVALYHAACGSKRRSG